MTASYLSQRQIEQLLRRTRIEDNGCIVWTGYINPGGYGGVRIGGRSGKWWLTHRLMYALWNGPLVDGLQIDHLCRNRACLAPYHLEQVTAKVNTNRSTLAETARAMGAAVTHCPQGHPYDEANTYYPPNHSYRHRMCRTCMRARRAAWGAKRRAVAAR